MQRSKQWYWLILAGIFLITLSACLRRKIEGTLSHPAVSLLKADVTLMLRDPTWSPNEDLLAVNGTKVCIEPCYSNIYTLNSQTGELHLLIDDTFQANPSWTSDPATISYARENGIYILDLGNDSALPKFVASGFLSSWSSDGKYVAIARGRGPTTSTGYTRPSIIVLDLATNQEQKVFETPEAREEVITGLSWAPNNSQLALSASWWEADRGYVGGIFIVNVDGTGLQQMVEKAGLPGWMPDAEWLYFLEGDGELAFAPLDFSCIVTPLDITGIDSAAISPDGEQLAFEHEGNIYLLDLDKLLGEQREALVCP